MYAWVAIAANKINVIIVMIIMFPSFSVLSCVLSPEKFLDKYEETRNKLCKYHGAKKTSPQKVRT